MCLADNVNSKREAKKKSFETTINVTLCTKLKMYKNTYYCMQKEGIFFSIPFVKKKNFNIGLFLL